MPAGAVSVVYGGVLLVTVELELIFNLKFSITQFKFHIINNLTHDYMRF